MAAFKGWHKYLAQFSEHESHECGNCTHFTPHDSGDFEKGSNHGCCLRFPPSNKEGDFPEMAVWQGCGEWKENEYVQSRAMCNSLKHSIPDEIWETIQKKTDEFRSKIHHSDYWHFIAKFTRDESFRGIFDMNEQSWVVRALLEMSYDLSGDDAQKAVQDTKQYREENREEVSADF